MKKYSTLLFCLALAGTAALVSCKKEKDTCDGGNLCFTLNGMDVSVNAVRKSLPNDRFRLYWEEGSGNNYKNIEIDIYGNSVGEYTFTDNAGTAGDAGFQYYINENGSATNYQGTGGSLELTSIDNNVWTGTFSGSVTDGTNSYELKDGKFFEVAAE